MPSIQALLLQRTMFVFDASRFHGSSDDVSALKVNAYKKKIYIEIKYLIFNWKYVLRATVDVERHEYANELMEKKEGMKINLDLSSSLDPARLFDTFDWLLLHWKTINKRLPH